MYCSGTSEHDKSSRASVSSLRECWICYDTSENTSAGPMIEPCLCRGDVAAVHHNCLRQWLMECAQANNTEQLACKVCQAEYELERSPNWWIGQGFTARQWLHTAFLVTLMCGTIAGAWTVLQMYQDALVRSMTAGVLLLMIYLCLRWLYLFNINLRYFEFYANDTIEYFYPVFIMSVLCCTLRRFLGFNTFTAYQRARYSAVKILNRHFTGNSATPSSPSRGSVSSSSTESTDIYSSEASVSTIPDGQVSLDITPVPPM